MKRDSYPSFDDARRFAAAMDVIIRHNGKWDFDVVHQHRPARTFAAQQPAGSVLDRPRPVSRRRRLLRHVRVAAEGDGDLGPGARVSPAHWLGTKPSACG